MTHGEGSEVGRLPDFLVIGAARSGTTSLHRYLDAHPQVFMAYPKELFFFDLHHDRGEDWYRSQFAEASPDQVAGEASPEYMLNADAPARMAELVPGAKLIAILRHPVDRAYSHYWHRRRMFPDRASFEEVVRPELEAPKREPTTDPGHPHPLLASGRYVRQLERVCEHYPRESLLVLLFEDLRSDPHGTFGRICDFIGVDPGLAPSDVGRAYGEGRRLRSEGLKRFMLRARAYRRLPRWLTSTVERVNWTGGGYPPLDPDLRRELVDWFREDNAALAEWLGRDLSMWDR